MVTSSHSTAKCATNCSIGRSFSPWKKPKSWSRVDATPKYLGICEKDTTALKDRMGRYKGQLGGGGGSISTNERVSNIIRQMLDQGKRVEIYALKPATKDIFMDLQVDLVKGLENPLIASFKPEWNR